MNEESGMKNLAKNTWKLLFRVEEAVTGIVLFHDEEELDRVRIEPNRELLEKILPVIDDLLARHSLVSSDIADIRVESELPDGYSSRRIAETVAGVWRLGRDEEERNAENAG